MADGHREELSRQEQDILIEAYFTHGTTYDIKGLLERLIQCDGDFRKRVGGHTDKLVFDGMGSKASLLREALTKFGLMEAGPHQNIGRRQTIDDVSYALRQMRELGRTPMRASPTGSSSPVPGKPALSPARPQAVTPQRQGEAPATQVQGQNQSRNLLSQRSRASQYASAQSQSSDRPPRARRTPGAPSVSAAQAQGQGGFGSSLSKKSRTSSIGPTTQISEKSQAPQSPGQGRAYETPGALPPPTRPGEVHDIGGASVRQIQRQQSTESRTRGSPCSAGRSGIQEPASRDGAVVRSSCVEDMEALV